MSEERYKLIKENVFTRCHIAEYTGIGLSCTDKEEIELIDYVEELKDQLQQKEIERLSNITEALDFIDRYLSLDLDNFNASSLLKKLREILIRGDKE